MVAQEAEPLNGGVMNLRILRAAEFASCGSLVRWRCLVMKLVDARGGRPLFCKSFELVTLSQVTVLRNIVDFDEVGNPIVPVIASDFHLKVF